MLCIVHGVLVRLCLQVDWSRIVDDKFVLLCVEQHVSYGTGERLSVNAKTSKKCVMLWHRCCKPNHSKPRSCTMPYCHMKDGLYWKPFPHYCTTLLHILTEQPAWIAQVKAEYDIPIDAFSRAFDDTPPPSAAVLSLPLCPGLHAQPSSMLTVKSERTNLGAALSNFRFHIDFFNQPWI